MSILTIINELAAIGSTLAKTAILEKNKDNEVLHTVFDMTENPRYNFYIKLPKNLHQDRPAGNQTLTVPLLKGILDSLNGRRVTGHAARDYLHDIMLSLNLDDRQVLNRVINHDLECKTGTALVNKTWPGTIPVFKIMLADKFNAKTVKNLIEDQVNPKIAVQTKYDGGRVNPVMENGKLTIYSRAGNPLFLWGTFDSTFLGTKDNTVYDGEMICVDKHGQFLDRKTSNGIFNKAVRGTITAVEAATFRLVLWDTIPIHNWSTGETYNSPYKTRLKEVESLAAGLDRVWVADTVYCNTIDEVKEQYAKARARKEEGVIVKSIDMPWEDARSKFMLKMKAVEDATLRCVGTKPHSKNPAWIGSLECVSADGEIEVSVGSGLDEKDRAKDPSEFIGQLISVEYNELIKARNAKKYSLYLAIYVGIRLDQTDADDLKKFQ